MADGIVASPLRRGSDGAWGGWKGCSGAFVYDWHTDPAVVCCCCLLLLLLLLTLLSDTTPNMQVLLVLLLSTFEWRLAARMGSPQQVLSRVVAALELRVEGGMWLCPKLRAPQKAL
jgi:hypothetical protein